MNPLIQLKTTPQLLIILTLLCFGILPTAQAVVPAPDGGYPNFTTAEGTQALQNLTTGSANTGVGFRALFSAGASSFNTGVGAGALVLNTADSNTAVGAVALLLNTTGTLNTATGVDALALNNSGSNNTANGAFALFSNGKANNNTAVGDNALLNNDHTVAGIGNNNTAVGNGALQNNVDGDSNTAVGAFALFNENATGGFPNGVSNNAIGRQALFTDTTGSFNQAMGVNALVSNTTGSGNIAIGDDAMFNSIVGSGSTAVGAGALLNATGASYIAVGANAGTNQTTGNNDLYIGDAGSPGESNVIAIGALASSGTPYTDCFIGGIFGNPNPGVAVFIDSAGHLSTTASSRRFKDEIKPMAKTSEAIFALKPVTFRYKKELDPDGTARFGLVAEDVEKVNPDLVARDREGKVYTVRYEAVNAMLLNEFLKEHCKVEEQSRKIDEEEATITKLKQGFQSKLAAQQKQIKALTAGLQKVSAQIEASKPAPQMVNNP